MNFTDIDFYFLDKLEQWLKKKKKSLINIQEKTGRLGDICLIPDCKINTKVFI